jgi:peptidoglycan hydrolase CwlO-like protein
LILEIIRVVEMTYKEIDKKINRIKKQSNSVEKEIVLRKGKFKPFKKQITNENKFLKEWEELKDRVSSLWDKKFTAVEEIRDQREKNY